MNGTSAPTAREHFSLGADTGSAEGMPGVTARPSAMRVGLRWVMGPAHAFDLHQQLFHLFSLVGLGIAFICTAINYTLGLGFVAVGACAAVAVGLLACYLVARTTGRSKAAAVVALIIIIFVFTPVQWLANAGSQGGFQYFGIIFTLAAAATYRNMAPRLFFIGGYCAVVALLLLLEFQHPEWVNGYSTREDRYWDVGVSQVLATLFVIAYFHMYVSKYNEEHERVLDYSQRLHKMATTDGLTRLYNRRHLMDRLEERMAEYHRYGTPFSIIMVDLDHFKQINDKHGHTVGDEVLVALADVLRSNLRVTDLVGRYGGEEFIIVAPHTDLAGVLSLDQKIRTAVAAHPWGSSLNVTLSSGVVQCAHASIKDLINAADKLLFQAKRNGRNRHEHVLEAVPASA